MQLSLESSDEGLDLENKQDPDSEGKGVFMRSVRHRQ
jgi:hypothetical protein